MGCSDHDGRLRRRLFFAALPLPFLYALGAYAFWPIIKPEFARRDTWEIAMGAAEDGVAIFWYLRFVSGYILRVPLERSSALPVPQATAQWRRVAVSMVCGALLKALSIAITFHTEKSAYSAANTTTAQAKLLKRIRFPNIIHYRLECRFEDSMGTEHTFQITAVDERGRPPVGYPSDVVAALRNGQTLLSIPIRFDPANPARAWIEGTGGIDDNSTFYASLTLIMFQMMGLALFALCFLPVLRAHARRGLVPWWADIYKIMPLDIEAIFLSLFGSLELFLNHLR